LLAGLRCPTTKIPQQRVFTGEKGGFPGRLSTLQLFGKDFSVSGSEGAALMASAQKQLRIAKAVPGCFDPERLIQEIAAGDQLALTRFYAATSGLLFGLLLLILGDTEAADKVLLEVYTEVKQHARRFGKARESLLTWLITIAHRRALEHLCARAGDREFAMSVGLAGPHDPAAIRNFGISKSAHRRLIGASLDSLSPAERKMIELAYFSRLTTHAIAARLRQTPEAVKLGLQLGVSRLYNLFKNREFVRNE
jgi:RNA polymerase sigma-70 factor, ECF subfamily